MQYFKIVFNFFSLDQIAFLIGGPAGGSTRFFAWAFGGGIL